MYAQASFAPAQPTAAPPSETAEALARLYAGESLQRAEAQTVFGALVAGTLSEPDIAALLIALRVKGETEDELIGAAQALRAADFDFDRPDYLFADSCGTGGDGSGSINVSTAVAFVAAAAGLPMVKHGNRSFTSRCGSADVLEALGANLYLTPAQSRRVLDETGICFLFAPVYHPGLRHAGPVRRQLKVRTIMNLLGPCLNPAEPPVQLLGVADPKLLEPVAATVAALGVERALLVHGSGLDEIAIHGATVAIRVQLGRIDPLVLTPEDAGLKRAPLEAIRGGDPKENATRLASLLKGAAPRAEADLVALNTGALLMTAGLSETLREGVEQASDVIASGEAFRVLGAFTAASHG